MLQRNCSLVVYLAALKARSLSHTHIIKKDLRGFLYGKESKKAPSLLKSNANHSLTYKCAPPHDWGQIPSVAGCAFYMSLNDWLCKDRKIFAMTLFEILNFNRELLERLAGTGYKPDDYKYIDLYKEYEQMRHKGEKVTYCVAFLSARHGVSERKVYEILGRFKKECTFHAV